MGGFEIRVELAVSALASFRGSLDAWLEERGMGADPRAAVVLASHEAVANAIQHSAAATPVTVRGESRPCDFLIEITDEGTWKIPEDPPSEERGRGLELIRSLVSETEIRKSDGGTTVRLIQHRT